MLLFLDDPPKPKLSRKELILALCMPQHSRLLCGNMATQLSPCTAVVTHRQRKPKLDLKYANVTLIKKKKEKYKSGNHIEMQMLSNSSAACWAL